ncbi:MAG: hypothetical protein CM15mP36_11740 [Flavobacteriales bacterium]|nr:MAG: hypothetical protein CM15mP36_11740 [Flavobacteriales bacterium]
MLLLQGQNLRLKATLNEEKKLLADEGKQILRRKLKSLKINFNDSIITELQKYFKLIQVKTYSIE